MKKARLVLGVVLSACILGIGRPFCAAAAAPTIDAQQPPCHASHAPASKKTPDSCCTARCSSPSIGTGTVSLPSVDLIACLLDPAPVFGAPLARLARRSPESLSPYASPPAALLSGRSPPAA